MPEGREQIAAIFEKFAAEALKAAGAAAVSAIIARGLTALTTTNYRKESLSGTSTLHASESDNSINESRHAAASTEGALAQNEVAGQEGTVLANETEAAAAGQKARAANADAEAVKTRAGALNTSTTALGIN